MMVCQEPFQCLSTRNVGVAVFSLHDEDTPVFKTSFVHGSFFGT
jgi:hypothetical protein